MQELPETLISAHTSSDRSTVRVLSLVLATAAFASAQSHPSWWTYASPDATALVGIQWESLRQSPFGETVATELSATGGLGFPDLDCLKQARQIVLSAPSMLAIEWGTFPAATVREQALRAGLGFARYRTITLYVPQKGEGLGVAQMTPQLVLVGARKTLEAAIDNSLAEKDRRYSPLLARAARFSRTADLWVVATQLPDPLASIFVPIDADTQGFNTPGFNAQGFEGALSVQDGLLAEAWIDAESEQAAAGLAKHFRQAAPSFPPMARGVQVGAAATKVTLALQLTPEQLAASLSPKPRVETAVNVRPAVAAPPPPTPPAPAEAPAVFSVTVERSAVPRVIRIEGLDDGPKIIPFPDPPPKY
jgi:hypothetical protein